MAQRQDHPVLIEVALNGVSRQKRNRNVPISVDEIVRDSVACLKGGAQIIHQHDDLGSEGELGGASPEEMAAKSGAVYERVLSEHPDALLYPTANWGGTHEERWRHQEILKDQGLLRMAFLDPGSVNLGVQGPSGIPERGFVYDHGFDEVRRLFERAEEKKLAPNMAIFEPGFLRTILAYESAGKLPAGSFAKLYFGDRVLFGHPPTRKALEAYLELLDGSRLVWAVAVLGGDVIRSGMARWALESGGHLRIGLEDYAGPGSPSNSDLLEQAITLCEQVGRPLASSSEAAELLEVPVR
ncbi:3-keto-5-aminohexanoate cleavage protein [Myxococcota bacterium]|nr:3-keto-5-aminohexanoate cleavage protein [Myxococcota bacterium]|tara:strand:- start:2474 stop:3367 length:894 start_codon:yes stop_codon:yes gene_type:complete